MMVKEQFVKKCSSDLSVYLKEKSFENLEEMAHQAERFLIAAKQRDGNKKKSKPSSREDRPSKPKPETGVSNSGGRRRFRMKCISRRLL